MQFENASFWYESVILNDIYHPRNTHSEIPFGLYSIFGNRDRQSGHHRNRIARSFDSYDSLKFFELALSFYKHI
jgi:hypothetical protein